MDELKAKQSDPGNTIFEIGGQYYALTDECVPQTGRFAVKNPYNGKSSYFYGSENADENGYIGFLMKGWVQRFLVERLHPVISTMDCQSAALS